MATLEFLLNGTLQQCDVSPDTSILTLLREHLALKGTKEGCASGDCGACTVAIGDPSNDIRRFASANACITPAHQLQGRHLVTIEGLAQGGDLHPAQEAMIKCHGSQCGFCTPGIVMSLFTLYGDLTQRPAPLLPEQSQELSQERLEASLGGNLCRCTGYRPIRDAALGMNDIPYERPQWFDATLSASESEGRFNHPAAESAFFCPASNVGSVNRATPSSPKGASGGGWHRSLARKHSALDCA